MLPLSLPELAVSGLALVTAIDDCPPIADGEGSVVTARFVTREVHVVASLDVLGADGTVETITGTTIHPVWSVDRPGPRHHIQHFCVRELGTRSETYRDRFFLVTCSRTRRAFRFGVFPHVFSANSNLRPVGKQYRPHSATNLP